MRCTHHSRDAQPACGRHNVLARHQARPRLGHPQHEQHPAAGRQLQVRVQGKEHGDEFEVFMAAGTGQILSWSFLQMCWLTGWSVRCYTGKLALACGLAAGGDPGRCCASSPPTLPCFFSSSCMAAPMPAPTIERGERAEEGVLLYKVHVTRARAAATQSAPGGDLSNMERQNSG